MDIYVGRQPILSKNKDTFAYELLFRDSFKNSFPGIDGDIGTSKLLSNTFFSMGINEITSNKPGFINFTQDLLLSETPMLFPKENIVIEILENVEPEPEVVNAIRKFRKAGYKIALDDFIFDPKFKPLIRLAHIIKFDLMATPLPTITNLVKRLKSKLDITLLAEKIETYEEFALAKDMGFSLFQGYFFSKPEVISNKAISGNQMTLLNLLSEIGKKDLDFEKLSSLIKNDISISYKLMKFINSPYYKRHNEISTVRDAVSFLGEETIKQFVRIVAAAGLSDSKPDELMRLSIVRARMCEVMGKQFETRFTSEELFTLGLFSTIDAMLDKEMETILQEISFSDQIKTGLLGKDDTFNKMLNTCLCFEKGSWRKESPLHECVEPPLNDLPSIYLDAVKMADNFLEV